MKNAIDYFLNTRISSTRGSPLWFFAHFLFFSCRNLFFSSSELLSFAWFPRFFCRRSISCALSVLSFSSSPRRPVIFWSWHSWFTDSRRPSPACWSPRALEAACSASSCKWGNYYVELLFPKISTRYNDTYIQKFLTTDHFFLIEFRPFCR